MESAKTDRKQHILASASELLRNGGREAVTTRAVSEAAGIQPPTLYRLFGDMRGVLDAVAFDVFEKYIKEKPNSVASDDSVEKLQDGWDRHVQFGFENPDVFLYVYADGRPNLASGVAAEGLEILVRMIERVALNGNLAVPVDHAVDLMHTGSQGIILSLINQPENTDRLYQVSKQLRDLVIANITSFDAASSKPQPSNSVVRNAVSLFAALKENSHGFTGAEQKLLQEWLRRLMSE